jgi:addiction module HigA family antidote
MLLPKNPNHPGEILLEDFLKPMGITQARLAAHLGLTPAHVNEIITGKRGITPRTAWLLSQAFGNSPQFWLNLQMFYDLAHDKPAKAVRAIGKAAKAS